MTNWRAIEEAPRDGRSVLLWARLKTNPPSFNDFYPIVGFWHHSIQEWKVWPEHLCRNFCPRTHTCVDGSPRELDANIQAWSDATRPNFNGRAMVFQQELAPAEADEAVGQWAIPFRQGRSAGGQTLQMVALAFPPGQPLERSFAEGHEQART